MAITKRRFRPEQGYKELNRQLDMCPTEQGKFRVFVEEFLIREGIYTLSEVTDKVKMRYRGYVKNSADLTDKQKIKYQNRLELFIMYYLCDEYPAIRDGIINRSDLDRCMRHKIGTFLMENGISDISEIDIDLRERFEQYLYLTISEKKAAEYLKGFDKLKLEAIREENKERPFVKRELKYDGKKVFLPYHPDIDVAMSLYYCQDKTRFLYDIPAASEMIGRQIVDTLNWVFREKRNKKTRHDMFLMPLSKFFRYCIEKGVEDIETMDTKDMIGWRDYIRGNVGTKETEYIQIVYAVQKFLFCSDKKTRWDANSWFMERFRFKDDRMNPSRPVSRLSFWQVNDRENREYFKAYVKYKIGLTNTALETIRSQYYGVKDFMMFCDEMGYRVKDLSREIMEAYAEYLDLKDIEPQTFNKSIISVFRFWDYMSVCKKAKKPEVPALYFLKKVTPKHNDLSVSEEDQQKVIDALTNAPGHLQMMFLNLYATGCRINEICTIRADAYESDGEKAFMRVNQYKMKQEKLIPIPMELFRVMTGYIREAGKSGGDFVFTRKDGIRPYDPGNVSKQIKRILVTAGVDKESYNFRAHGYRHRIGTYFYHAGVSVQTIRDYLGHRDENMTKQYIDYMGECVRQASRKYFKEKEKKDRK